MRLIIPALFVLLVCGVRPVLAQEVQVPIDEEGRVTVIDAELEARLGLFPDYERFREARLFRLPDGSYELVVRYGFNDAVAQQREVLTQADVEALRRRVSEALIVANVRPELDQRGRVRLLRTSALMSILAYGPSLAAILQLEDDAAVASTVLLTGAAGFYVPYLITQSRPVTPAAGALTSGASVIGFGHGAALAGLIGGDAVSLEAVLGSGMAVSLAEAIVAYRLATDSDLSHGAADLMTAGSLFGAGIGLGSAVLVLGDEPDDTGAAIRTSLGLALVGSAAGVLAAHRISGIEHTSRGDARLISTVGLLGYSVGGSVVQLLDLETPRGVAAALVVGPTGGLVAGHLLTRGREFGASQANYIALAAVAGGFAGGSVARITGASNGPAAALATAGSIIGFGLMYRAYADEAADRGRRALELSAAPVIDPFSGTVRAGVRLQVKW